MSDTDQFSDQEIMAKTLWGEARNQGQTGMYAVACVLVNRVNSGVTWWGNTLRTCALKPWQFSCFNKNDPNRPKLIEVTDIDPQYAQALDIAADAINGGIADITNGATSYFDSRMDHAPVWAVGKTPCAKIGEHLFYKI